MSNSGENARRTAAEARVAVIGAGMSGLACARELAARGVDVTVFDKGRAAGGRLSTRREGVRRLDHGAISFRARGDAFVRAVREWETLGVVARWSPRLAVLDGGQITTRADAHPRWVGTPSMRALGEHLAEGLDVRCETRVEALDWATDGWTLRAGDAAFAGFSHVIVSAPAPQSAALLAPHAPELSGRAGLVHYASCWSLSLVFDAPLGLPFDHATALGSLLDVVARDASKPGRAAAETWVVHASRRWSEAFVDAEPERVADQLLGAFAHTLGRALPTPRLAHAHRWRFAEPRAPLGVGSLWDPARAVGACGDWCIGGRVEDAWTSGRALGAQLGDALSADAAEPSAQSIPTSL